MKRTFLYMVAMWMPLMVMGQSWGMIMSDKQTYLYGEGYAETVEEADMIALKDLISKISVGVSNDVHSQVKSKTTNGELDEESLFEQYMNTYSEATLTNTEKLIISNEPDAHVGRYVKRTEVEKIFEGRKQKVMEYIRLAQKAERKYKLDDALRNYYWALTLLQTIQYASEVVYEDEDGIQHTLLTWIPQQINDILDDIKITYKHMEDGDLTLGFTYKGVPIASIDYSYFDGRDWSNLYSCRDGIGVLELPTDVEVEHVQLRFEYAYRGQAHIDRELESVMKVVKSKAMRKSYQTLDLASSSAAADVAVADQESVPQTAGRAYETTMVSEAMQKNYTATMNTIIQGIRSRNYSSIDKYFTPYGKEVFEKLIQYGNAKVVETPPFSFTQLEKDVLVRKVPMSFSFANGSRKAFVENVVFTFDEQGKVDNVAFGLDDIAYNDVMSKTVWPEQARLTIVNFLENYKTAFALKRIDYIESIFADDAIIIVGKMVQRVEQSGDNSPQINKYIQRTQYTKAQYISNLKGVFAKNEFVNIRFGNTMVTKAGAGRGELYGIQLKQDYYSSHYGDTGYLYLQVELDDPDRPLIRIRTWQDRPDPEVGRPYGMEDF